MDHDKLTKAIQRNCNISDARDNGIYSICTLVLKLRNLYKWENDLAPWVEPDPPVLLDWIEAKENFWETIAAHAYESLPVNGRITDPFDLETVNIKLADANLFYGAGYGRSLKSIFFLAEKVAEKEIEGCQVTILGKELARELVGPIAMLQGKAIIIRRDAMRFFFWDQMQEIRTSSKASLHHALSSYDLMVDNRLDNLKFREKLDEIVDREIPFFIYHEIGEMREDTIKSETAKKIISAFPDSPVEFLVRALKDILADTHPQGMLDFIIRERRDSSLGFYVGFLDGLRRLLFPELAKAFTLFLVDRDWGHIDEACKACRQANRQRAEILTGICGDLADVPMEIIKTRINQEILTPLGLDTQN